MEWTNPRVYANKIFQPRMFQEIWYGRGKVVTERVAVIVLNNFPFD